MSEFTNIRNEVCMKYCNVYGIDLLQDIIDFRGIRIHNMLNDWKMANTFWETFADEITPLVLEDTAFTVDGPYEIKELNVTTAYGEYVLDVGAN